MLIIFGGLPGTGKTSIARELALRLDAVHLRIDSIEQAILDSGVMRHSIADAGYRVGCAIASDNLSLGKTVIADAVNPMIISRKAWRQVADHARTTAVEVEMICSDAGKHKRRVELRKPDIPGLKNPTWKDVLARISQTHLGGVSSGADEPGCGSICVVLRQSGPGLIV